MEDQQFRRGTQQPALATVHPIILKKKLKGKPDDKPSIEDHTEIVQQRLYKSCAKNVNIM